MSLVCHRIVSEYTPKDDEVAENEIEQDSAWEKDHFFGNTRRLHSKPAPTFIPAALQYDEFGIPRIEQEQEEEIRVVQNPKGQGREDVSLWYRGITAKKEESSMTESFVAKTNVIAGNSASTPILNSHTPYILVAKDTPRKPNWFSTRPLNWPENANLTRSSLADLLSRNPPPLPSEPAFTPPIFLTLGPSNKGFEMLQKKGWKEGEGLGKILRADSEMKVAQVQKLRPEVIDLTQSDSEKEEDFPSVIVINETESEAEEEANESLEDLEMDSTSPTDAYECPAHGGTALITPLGTVLKADRLGIGLKARRTKKAVTHSSAELAAFVRKKRRLEQQKWGRGSKGLARKSREEEHKRIQMLKYLNE